MVTPKAEVKKADKKLIDMDNKNTKIIVHLSVIVVTIVLTFYITQALVLAIPSLPSIFQEIADRHYGI